MAEITRAPGTGRTVRGGGIYTPGGEGTQGTNQDESHKVLTAEFLPNGPRIVVRGREAQTLALLIERDSRGFTPAEASTFRWARRTSSYVFRLRRRGVMIATLIEIEDGVRVGRYVLAGRMRVLDQ